MEKVTHISQKLKKLREARGLKISEVARKVGVASSTYREWELGRQIKGEPYLKICQVLNVSLAELLTGLDSSLQKQMALKNIEEIEKNLKELKNKLLVV